MAYDETTVERIRRILSKRRGVVEQKMIGGLSFMVSGKLRCRVKAPQINKGINLCSAVERG
jgi:hypothetical protein